MQIISLIMLTDDRAFDNDEVLHVDDSVDPVRDLSKFHKATQWGSADVSRHHPERAMQEGSGYIQPSI